MKKNKTEKKNRIYSTMEEINERFFPESSKKGKFDFCSDPYSLGESLAVDVLKRVKI